MYQYRNPGLPPNASYSAPMGLLAPSPSPLTTPQGSAPMQPRPVSKPVAGPIPMDPRQRVAAALMSTGGFH